MWEILVLLVIGGVAWLRLQSVESENRRLRHDLAAVRLEINALRQAFLKRISALEEARADAPPQASSEVSPPPVTVAEPQPSHPSEPDIAAVEEAAPAPQSVVEALTPPAPAAPLQSPPIAEQPKIPVRINWEQWVGVRGAAVLGAAVLGLAAVLFLQYSIERGLISPALRVAVGFITGALAVAASEWLRKKSYSTQADALAGGGVIILYAATWAARILYGFIGSGTAGALMVLITVVCGYLAWQHHALSTALLGLLGGFATPLLLSTGQDRPITLFAYLLMLNVGLYALSRARNWPILSALAMLATVLYQAGWIFTRMDADGSRLGLCVLGVFAAFYFASVWAQGEQRSSPIEKWARAAGVVTPFGFAAYFAASVELSPQLFPLAGLLALLSLATAWLGRDKDVQFLPVVAAAADVGIVTAWVSQTTLDPGRSWELAIAMILIAASFHAPWEWFTRRDPEDDHPSFSVPALASATGLALLLAPTSGFNPAMGFVAWLTALAGLTMLLIRQDALRERIRGAWASSLAIGVGFAVAINYRPPLGQPARYWLYLLALIFSAALLLPARFEKDSARKASLLRAAVLAPIMLAIGMFPLVDALYVPDLFFLAVAVVLGLLLAIAAEQLGHGGALTLAACLVAILHWLWAIQAARGAPAGAALALMFSSLLLFTAWPLALPGLRENRWALRASALAGPLWFAALYGPYERVFGEAYPIFLPLVLAMIAAAALVVYRGLPLISDASKKHTTVWYAAVALSFIAVAIPLQFEKEWVLIGWAIQGALLMRLWQKLDHPGLKYFALSLLAVVTGWLLLPDAWAFHSRSGQPILNWLLYTYLVPAAALIASAIALRASEVKRARGWEAPFYPGGQPIGAGACGFGGIVVIFVWVNLTVLDVFSTGREIDFGFERMAARDLTLSFAWALFALTLLAVGFRTQIQALRWVSLAFLLVTIGKVFLYDLGELEDLYRVASLVGLALSLILVSLAYQRFVFGQRSD